MNTDINISEIMTRDVISVEKGDDLMEIRETLETRNFHHLVVLQEEEVCGIISFNDLTRAIRPFVEVDEGMPRLSLTAEDIMTPDPITIDPEDSIGLAADVILTNRLHALPVTKKGKLQGIVTSHDILKYCFS